MSVPKAIRETVREPEEGKWVLLIAQNIWGKGATVAAAYANLRKQGHKARDKALAYHVHPDAYCEDIHGDIVSPTDNKPVLVARVNKTPGKHDVL